MPPKDKSIANNNLSFLRRICRLSQSEVALLLGDKTGDVIDTTTISKHEAGTRNPEERELKAYALIYKVPVAVLYRDVCSQADLITLMANKNDNWLFYEELTPEIDA